VRHDVYFPAPPPIRVGRVGSSGNAQTGVGAKEVNDAKPCSDLLDKALHGGFIGDIGCDRDARDFFCNRFRIRALDIGNHDRSRSFGSKTPAQRAPDPVASTRDYNNFVSNLHDLLILNA
jgi:hypothetical protein